MREEDTRMDFSKLRGMQVSEDGLMDLYDRGENRKSSMKKKKQQPKPEMNTTKIIPLTEVELPSIMSVKEFAETIKKTASEVIKKLFSLGIMATVNQEIDFDTAFLVAGEFGITATLQVVVTEEDVLFDDTDDDESELEVRPPIVTIMGHVDHGKTSLLDKIRATNVVAGESGGITQHIGAYKVSLNDREITFLDTPGHEAFSEMRARGAQVTDIVIIVVAADDSIKPQTIEAINHAKAADVPIIVAINKIDKPAANVEKVKQDLLEHDLVAEEWGGQTICVPVSAKTGEGIDNLLEMVLLVADMQNLRANPHKQAKGTVIEAKLDKSRGPLATVLVQRGTLNVGDTIVLGEIIGRVRVMTNDKGEKVKTAGPSTPVELLGLGAVPSTGDVFYEVEDEKTAHKLIERRKAEQRINLMKKGSTVTLDDLFDKIKDGELKNLDIVLRADVQGSVEALKSSLEKLSTDEVRVRVIASNTGGITESDVTLAKLSHAIIIGFNVRPDANVTATADKEKVDIRLYRVIYDAINDVEAAMKGMLKPTYKEVVHGQAEVRHLFKISSVGTICGSYVTNGKIVRNAMMRVVRDGVIVIEDKLDSLKREKDDAKEVAQGYECGIKLEKFNDVKEGDILECYEMVEEARS
jgi:translation initiation factor IF-2